MVKCQGFAEFRYCDEHVSKFSIISDQFSSVEVREKLHEQSLTSLLYIDRSKQRFPVSSLTWSDYVDSILDSLATIIDSPRQCRHYHGQSYTV